MAHHTEASVNSAKSGQRALNISKCLLSKYHVTLSEVYALRILLLSNLVQSVQAVQLTVGLNVLGFIKQLLLFYRIFSYLLLDYKLFRYYYSASACSLPCCSS